MKKTVLLYGILGGLLIAGLKLVEYRFLVLEHSFEIYVGLIALIFSAVGIWLGGRRTFSGHDAGRFAALNQAFIDLT